MTCKKIKFKLTEKQFLSFFFSSSNYMYLKGTYMYCDNTTCNSNASNFRFYSQFTLHVTSISENEMIIQISLCNIQHVNGLLNISLEISPKKIH